MKKKKLIVSAFLLFTIFITNLLILNPVYADTLKLNITSDKEKIKNGEEIKIRVLWNQEMQAADYCLNYDASKLEYIKSDIDDVYINNDSKEGKIKTAWVSIDDSKKTSIEYIFKIKNNGQLKFTTNVDGGFATENMEVPDKYQDGELTIGTQENNTFIFFIVGIVIVIILLFIIINNKKSKNKKR